MKAVNIGTRFDEYKLKLLYHFFKVSHLSGLNSNQNGLYTIKNKTADPIPNVCAI